MTPDHARCGRVAVPAGLDARRSLGSDWGAWLDRLPALLADLLDEWCLTVSGSPMHGHCSIVVPVTTDAAVPAALKVTFDGDDESRHEALALQKWNGDGVVRLFRADPRRRALLLERLESRDLSDVWDIEACEVVAGFYRRLHRPAPPQLPHLTALVGRWIDRLAADAADLPAPPRLVDRAIAVGRELCADAASDGSMIHGDLHYANVLAADREPWLVIDPKPVSGDPNFEVAPLLINRWDELAGDVRSGIERRFYTVVDAAGLDEDRARAWVLVRMSLTVHWTVEDARRARRGIDPEEREQITRCISVAKAVQS